MKLPWLRLLRIVCFGAGLVWANQSRAQSALTDDQLRTLCDARDPVYSRVPASLSAVISPARAAIFVSPNTVVWSGEQTPAVRYVLAHAADSSIQIDTNGLLLNATSQIDLSVMSRLPDELAREYSWLDAGLVLRLPDQSNQHDVMHQRLRGQLLLVALDGNNKVLRATELQTAALLDTLYSTADDPERYPLGVQVSATQTQWSVWAPTASAVHVCLYSSPKAVQEQAQIHAMQWDQTSGTWSVSIPANLTGWYYTYLVDVHVTGTGRVVNRVADPYSISLNANSKRSYIGDLDSPALKPAGWSQMARLFDRSLAKPASEDTVIYELHVRDFSWNDTSVPKQWRGKYRAFEHTQSAGMKHLKALAKAGITDIHLLPIFDFATVPEVHCGQAKIDLKQVAQDPASTQPQQAIAALKEQDCFNWGYDPLHFGAPEGSYATDADNGAARIRELRSMVLALKKLRLRVGMDVVYNHTSASGQALNSVLDKIVPSYYQRLNSQGQVETSTCCANTATEHRMMARLMNDTVKQWAKQYGIDSFRFDLMGHQPKAAMTKLFRQLNQGGRRIDFIGEGWNFGEVANNQRFVQATQGQLGASGIATFSDRARDAVRGGGCCDSGKEALERKGFVNLTEWQGQKEHALKLADLVRLGLAGTLKQVPLMNAAGALITGAELDYAGQKAGYADDVNDVVNYVENHDNQTLFDINVFKLPRDTTPEDRARVQVLALAVPALSFGVAYFHAGAELLRSKSLDRNSYDSGDWFNRIDWTGQSNGFGSGVPLRADHSGDWPMMSQMLRDTRVQVKPRHIAWTREQFFQLLAVRKSLMAASSKNGNSSLTQRALNELKFLNQGPNAIAGLIVAKLYDPTIKQRVVYALNAQQKAAHFDLSDTAGSSWSVHPAIKNPWFSPIVKGHMVIPARSWAVWSEKR
jgi:pullulanase